MMCWRVSVLILSMIEASVVLLPEPVGPGDEHEAARLVRRARRRPGGKPELVEREDLERNRAERARDGAALQEDVGAEARQVLHAEREVELLGLLELDLLLLGEHRVAELLGLDRRERRRA